MADGSVPEGRKAVEPGRALALRSVEHAPQHGPSDPDRQAAPLADFLTQLIACRSRLPAYRRYRRAEPDAATQAYHEPDARQVRSVDRVV